MQPLLIKPIEDITKRIIAKSEENTIRNIMKYPILELASDYHN